MNFSWDPEKNRRNVILHGIRFENAVRVFEGPTLEKVDDRFDYGEVRVYAIGLVDGVEVTVIYTDRSAEERRIISAWRAKEYERKAYWKAFGKASDRLGASSQSKRCRHRKGHRR